MCRRLIAALFVFPFAMNVHGAIREIGISELELDYRSTDFEAVTAGPISSVDTVFTDLGLERVELVGSWSSGDILNSGVFGNALVAQASGSGTVLAISQFFGPLSNQRSDGSGFAFSISGTATQFGYRVVDQVNNNMRMELYSGGGLINSTALNNDGSFPRPLRYFESDEPFDELRIVSTGSNGGWGIDDLGFGGKNVVPEPASLAIWGLGLLVGGLYLWRRPQQGVASKQL